MSEYAERAILAGGCYWIMVCSPEFRRNRGRSCGSCAAFSSSFSDC
jgi:hypothetical protein